MEKPRPRVRRCYQIRIELCEDEIGLVERSHTYQVYAHTMGEALVKVVSAHGDWTEEDGGRA